MTVRLPVVATATDLKRFAYFPIMNFNRFCTKLHRSLSERSRSISVTSSSSFSTEIAGGTWVILLRISREFHLKMADIIVTFLKVINPLDSHIFQ